MDVPGDSTQVIRILDDFKKYITSPRRSFSTSSSKDVATKLEFDESTCSDVLRNKIKKVHSNPVLGFSRPSAVGQQLNESNKKRQQSDKALLLAKSSISRLEAQISTVETSNKRARYDFEKELNNVKIEKDKAWEKSEDLNQKLNFSAKKEEYLQQKLSEAQQQNSKIKCSYEGKLNAVLKEKHSLQAKVNELQQTLDKTSANHNNDALDLKNQIQSADKVIEFYKVQLEKKQKFYDSFKSELANTSEIKIENERAQQKIRDLESKLMEQEENVQLASIYKSKADKCPELERKNGELLSENFRLRECSDNRLLLEEKCKGLQQKLQRLEEKLCNYNDVVMQNESLNYQLQEWLKACSKLINDPTPAVLKTKMNKLFQSEAVLNHQVGNLKNSNHMLELKLQKADEAMATVTKKLELAQQKDNEHNTFKRHMQKKLFLVSSERDSYQKLLNSYENDLTINPNTQAMERIQKLEDIIRNYRTLNEKLEEELNKFKNECGSASSSVCLKQIEDKDAEICRLQNKLDHIISEIGYDPTVCKILSMRSNPTSIAVQKRIDDAAELKEVNEKLRQRIKLLEETKGQDVLDLTAQVDFRVEQQGSIKSREKLQEDVNLLQLKLENMMEAFRKTTNNFREIVYLLFGFRVDVLKNNFYKLSSMYADSQEDHLLFLMDNGLLQLMETEFSNSIPELIETYLQGQGSIPAFLCGLTMDLLSKQTVAVALH